MHIGYAYIQDDDLGRNVKSWHLHKIFVCTNLSCYHKSSCEKASKVDEAKKKVLCAWNIKAMLLQTWTDMHGADKKRDM
jgi:hypothetical protein